MQFDLSAEYESFRAEVQSFLESNRVETGDKQAYRSFRRKAIDAGYLLRSVPRKYGGSEQPPDPIRLMVIDSEFRRAGMSTLGPSGMVGESLLVPTLLAHGSDWQKETFIPPTLAGELKWSQGYSEPNTGSDLAALTTRAELDGDEWVINGQKIWSTDGATADYMFALVRTELDERRHRGLSYFLIDLTTPGIVARPLEVMTGAAHFAEVFFDDVRVPVCNLVGARGDGWRVGNTTLSSERNAVGAAEDLMESYESLIELVKGSKTASLDDPTVQDKLLSIEGYIEAHRLSGYRQLSAAAKGESGFPLGLMNKLSSTDLGERMARLAAEVMGPDILVKAPTDDRPVTGDAKAEWRKRYYWALGYSIAGGTSNIQKNIIAERVLGLPKDVRGDTQS